MLRLGAKIKSSLPSLIPPFRGGIKKGEERDVEINLFYIFAAKQPKLKREKRDFSFNGLPLPSPNPPLRAKAGDAA